MKTSHSRTCDICTDEIPKGAKYYQQIIPVEKAELYFRYVKFAGIEPIPSWTQFDDKHILHDLCEDCYKALRSHSEFNAVERKA